MSAVVRKTAGALITLGAFAMLLSGVHSAQAARLVSKEESKCAATLGKGGEKINKTVLKEIGKCRKADISNKAPGPCPTPKNTAKIAAAKQKLSDATAKKCKSVCSVTQTIECIGDAFCPPIDSAPEACTAGIKNKVFDLGSISFPGPFCELTLGAPITAASQLGECTAELTEPTANQILDIIYGGLTNLDGISKGAQSCLKTISKDTQKLVSTIYKGVVKCRKSILDGKVVGNPATCTTDDTKLAAKIAKAEDKLTKDLLAKCSTATILELDLCGAGVGGTANVAAATACLINAANESTDTTLNPADRTFTTRSLVEAAYPPSGVCGDNIVNQQRNPFALLGEECDGSDDSACPGACLPPGDLYECTCPNTPRMRFMANGFTADLDNGWTGTSHNSGVTDKAGYVLELTACDCSANSGMLCTGTTSDPVCTTLGPQAPKCSWDPDGATSCDGHGDGNGNGEDTDCYICDSFNVNAGDFCANESACQAQCFPAGGGAPTGLCSKQADCSGSDICRGQCDRSPTCLIVPNGHPLPISSGGTAVCVVNKFREDVFGTQNILTGEHNSFVEQFSVVHLGVSNTVPCPMCGGFCDGGSTLVGDMCTGTCSVTTGQRCRFAVDCPSGETCTTASPDCPKGFCNLSEVCGGGVPGAAGPNAAQPCRVGAGTTLFGTVSSDCPPNAGQNISGVGLEIAFSPSTSEITTLPASLACTAPGFELFDCECPGGPAPGLKTQPNKCAGTCDAGINFGDGCANGAGFINGQFTTCAGGANVNRACDEDADCPASACSVNPTECSGDPATDNLPCTTNGDCALGTCVDACPGGRCVPLCIGGAGGDPEEGFCAGGPPFYHCDGAGDTFRICSVIEATAGCTGAVCAASCSASGTPSGGSGAACDTDTPCAGGEVCCGTCGNAQFCQSGNDNILGNDDDFPGAGKCVADIRNCFVQDIIAEGGDTINGNGSPNSPRTVSSFCIGETSNNAINSTAGLGGPGRLRQDGANVTNGFTSLP